MSPGSIPAGRDPHGSRPAAHRGERGEWITAATFVVLVVAFLVPLGSYRPAARTLPIIVGVPALLLALTNIVRLLIVSRRTAPEDPGDGSVDATGDGDAASRSGWRRRSPYAAVGWVVLAGGVTLVVGFLIGALVFLPLFMWLYGRQSLLMILAVTAGVVGLLYGVFIQLLNVPYYTGLLG